jgi:hypothetical protein
MYGHDCAVIWSGVLLFLVLFRVKFGVVVARVLGGATLFRCAGGTGEWNRLTQASTDPLARSVGGGTDGEQRGDVL